MLPTLKYPDAGSAKGRLAHSAGWRKSKICDSLGSTLPKSHSSAVRQPGLNSTVLATFARSSQQAPLDSLYIQLYAGKWRSTWDENKAKSNNRKHGILFADAVLALDDPCALTISDYESNPEEERFVTLGCDIYGRVLVVFYTYRRDDIRIISARPATRQECEEYRRQR